jgi:hypothetical protein
MTSVTFIQTCTEKLSQVVGVVQDDSFQMDLQPCFVLGERVTMLVTPHWLEWFTMVAL